MSVSTLKIFPKTQKIIDNSTLSTNITSVLVESTNQNFEWIDGIFEEGAAIYRKSGSYETGSINTDEEAEIIGVIETTSGSYSKLIYSGKISFINSSLTPGIVYFLTSSYDMNNTGSVLFRNMTSEEPLISKPILLALSETDGVVVNYRGLVNQPEIIRSKFELREQPIPDCNCLDLEEFELPIIPEIQLLIVITSSFVEEIISSSSFFNNNINIFPTSSTFVAGSPSSQSFIIENSGNSNLLINSYSFVSESSYFSVVPGVLDISPNGYKKINVIYDGNLSYSGDTLFIYNNNPLQPTYSIELT